MENQKKDIVNAMEYAKKSGQIKEQALWFKNLCGLKSEKKSAEDLKHKPYLQPILSGPMVLNKSFVKIYEKLE